MAKTEMALSRMITPNTWSGMRLLPGREVRIFSRTAEAVCGRCQASILASEGMEVTGFGSWASGSREFIRSTLSDICYKGVKGSDQQRLALSI